MSDGGTRCIYITEKTRQSERIKMAWREMGEPSGGHSLGRPF